MFIVDAMRVANKEAISEGKLRLGLFHPVLPMKYWRIQRERKQVVQMYT
jgi:hypothetical protein